MHFSSFSILFYTVVVVVTVVLVVVVLSYPVQLFCD